FNLTPTTILNTRAGITRFYNTESPPSRGVLDPAALGFSSRTVSQFSDRSGVPRLDIPGFLELGGRSPDLVAHTIYYAQPNVTKVFGNHSFRFGYDGRVYCENSYPPLDVAGRYRFRTDFTRLNDQSSTAAPNGPQELAAFLLGVPATATILVRPASRANQQIYHGVYVQDDWKVTQKLTLNLGLRYEYEGATTERYNRNIQLFDVTATNPIEARARAAYAAASSRPAEVPADAFRTPGGLVFPDENNRGFYEVDKNNFQPRLGFAYQWNERTVVRGGYAVYNAPFTIDGVTQTGFSFETASVPTTNNGLTIIASFADPFPTGIVEPPGSRNGLATAIGQQLGGAVNLVANTIDRRVAPLTIGPRKNPLIHRYELSLQRELPGRWLVELAYIGSTGRDLTTFDDINPVPRRFLSASPLRDAANITFLETTFPNPFRNLPEAAGTNHFSSSTLQRQQLLRPFPQYQSIFVHRHDGRSRYDSGQLRVERRFTQGFSIQGSYVFSKHLEEITKLNPTDGDYEKRLAEADSPHRFTMSGIY
ncbi:MAG: TonB-dependent receptor domain-containing protein, partial [Pyrinomonadaceae bacterium]